MVDKVYIGPNKVGHFEKGAAYPPLSRVTMWYDDEHFFTAGDDTGYIMTVDNPWATQEIVNDVYNQLKGFVYQPFEATGVSWDPSIELGDAVNIGGIYSMIGRREVKMGKEYIANISCPGEKEIDHDFPHYSKTERELKRRVKLGNKYQGVKIDRLNGLTITETDGETEGAKVVLNSKELSFYDAGGGRVLYFDPTSGTYKFLGELNVNDKFVVDKDGNVTLNGSIKWGVGNSPNKKRYAASTSGPWHDTMQSGDIYCCDWDYTAETWGAAYKFKGQDGTNGSNGSDAKVNRANIVKAMLESIDEDGLYTTDINGRQCLGINATAIITGVLSAIDILGCNYYSDDRMGHMKLGGGSGWSYLFLYDKNFSESEPSFAIGTKYDNVYKQGTIRMLGKNVLYYDEKADEVWPAGNWNFAMADNVSGVTATFK